MSLLSQVLGVGTGNIGGVLGGIGQSNTLSGFWAQQNQALMQNVAREYDLSALQNMAPPRPKPSADDFDLWVADSRDLTFEEWCQDRFGS